jgi:hypothetical protein
MKKDTYYFSHDYNARTDIKIKRLIAKHGYEGYGLYWAIIEDLYQNANALPMDCESIAFDLRTNENIVNSIINDFDLFIINDGLFGSLSVQRRLIERDERSSKARDSAFKRWNKDANAMQSHSEGNAIKERKGKETIEDISIRKLAFAKSLEPFLKEYGRDMLNDFYFHWAEMDKKGLKLKFEMQKTWELNLRLAKWKSQDKKFHGEKSATSTEHRKKTSGLI